jgi:multiple sugar transport system permease protein
MGVRQILSRIGLAFAAFVTVWPAILFFLWTATLSIKVGNASYPPVFSLS